MMDRKQYLKNNKIARTVALKNGLHYAQMFSFNGIEVTRTKFWLSSGSTKKMLNELNDLPFVSFAFEGQMRKSEYGFRRGATSVYVYYKR